MVAGVLDLGLFVAADVPCSVSSTHESEGPALGDTDIIIGLGRAFHRRLNKL